MREPEPLLSALRLALIGIEPLPFVIVPNVEADQQPITYYRRPNGDWTWQHPMESKGRIALARAGSRIAVELDGLLVELPILTLEN